MNPAIGWEGAFQSPVFQEGGAARPPWLCMKRNLPDSWTGLSTDESAAQAAQGPGLRLLRAPVPLPLPLLSLKPMRLWQSIRRYPASLASLGPRWARAGLPPAGWTGACHSPSPSRSLLWRKGGTGRNRDGCPGEPRALCRACLSPQEQPFFGSAGISARTVPSSWGPAPVKICPPPCRKHAFDSVPPSPPREGRVPSSHCRGHHWLAGGGHVEPSGRGGPACTPAEGAARQPPLTLGLTLGCVKGVGGTGMASRPLVDTWSRPGTFHLQLR